MRPGQQGTHKYFHRNEIVDFIEVHNHLHGGDRHTYITKRTQTKAAWKGKSPCLTPLTSNGVLPGPKSMLSRLSTSRFFLVRPVDMPEELDCCCWCCCWLWWEGARSGVVPTRRCPTVGVFPADLTRFSAPVSVGRTRGVEAGCFCGSGLLPLPNLDCSAVAGVALGLSALWLLPEPVLLLLFAGFAPGLPGVPADLLGSLLGFLKSLRGELAVEFPAAFSVDLAADLMDFCAACADLPLAAPKPDLSTPVGVEGAEDCGERMYFCSGRLIIAWPNCFPAMGASS